MTSAETMTSRLAALDGHLPYDHPLSPSTALKGLPAIIRRVVGYTPSSLWELETARLPSVLQAKRRQARQFAERELAPLALELDAMPHWPVDKPPQALLDLLGKAGKAGWLSDMFPRPFGSASLGETLCPIPLRACLKTEEFGRACGGQMLLLCAHMLGMAPLQLSFDLKNTRQLLLPVLRDLKQGKPHLLAFAVTEPGNGSDAEEGHGAAQAKPGLVARRVEGGWRLNGRKCFISGGDLAKSLTTFAALEGEGIASWTCFLVRSDMPGFRPTRTELKMGMRASGATELEFNEVFVPDSHVLGGLRNGWALSRQSLNMSRLPVAAMGVGFAQAATEIATDYACRATLGGKTLIHYQDVQLALAQMMAETSAIRALVWQSARTWAPHQATASMGKFHATDVAMRVIERAMDLLGSHALLHANRLEKVYRDCRVTQIFEGTNEINRLAVIEDFQGDLLGRMTNR
ncbi:acyl-CoA dehydrogenase family protein [Azotobacter armeniacus]